MAQIEKDSVSGTDTTGHEWDGLRELNTPLPLWWLYTFYACIAFAAVWVVLYPALPISGATGLLGWTARGAFPAQQAADAAQREPMMARLRSTSPAAILVGTLASAFTNSALAARKASNLLAYHALFPEYRVVLLGDSGQGDVAAGLAVLEAHHRSGGGPLLTAAAAASLRRGGGGVPPLLPSPLSPSPVVCPQPAGRVSRRGAAAVGWA